MIRSVRIIGGQFKRRRLALPAGVSVRPTSGRLKEAVFSTLQPIIAGARFLDLCAGTGAIGLEAASRGAASVVLIDRDPRCIAAICHNVALCRAEQCVNIIRADCLKALERLHRAGQSFDIIFADPPYDSDLPERILEALARWPELAAADAWVCLEHSPRHLDIAPLQGFEVQSRKSFGDQAVTVLRRAR